MKKYGLFVVCLLLCSLVLSGCRPVKKQQTINYRRKLEKYMVQDSSQNAGATIDLSEGPKLKYNANFGPNDVNFDIKIVNPY